MTEGFTLWFTGLSGAGKTTIAEIVRAELEQRGRKVEPLERALEPYDAWITGIRREQSLTRADAQKVEWSERYGVWKVQPIVDWDAKRVQAYIAVNEIPYNPLHDAGYPSIGCIPCTRPVVAGEEERAGRWAGSDKLECGIHGNTRLNRENAE